MPQSRRRFLRKFFQDKVSVFNYSTVIVVQRLKAFKEIQKAQILLHAAKPQI